MYCRFYGYSKDQLSNLFDSLIMSLFYYGIQILGAALQIEYLERIDRFLRRAYSLTKISYVNFSHMKFTHGIGTFSHMNFSHMKFTHMKLTHMELEPFHI